MQAVLQSLTLLAQVLRTQRLAVWPLPSLTFLAAWCTP